MWGLGWGAGHGCCLDVILWVMTALLGGWVGKVLSGTGDFLLLEGRGGVFFFLGGFSGVAGGGVIGVMGTKSKIGSWSRIVCRGFLGRLLGTMGVQG